LKVKPDFLAPIINRAALYMRRSQPDLALADLNRVIEVNPNNYAALTNRASVYIELEKFDLATKDLNKALDINTTGNTAMLLRGEIATTRGDYDNAIKDYTLSIRYDPDKPQAYNADCYTRALAKRDMETTALAECNKSLELRPDNAGTLDSRGFLYLQLCRYVDAVADYDAALSKDAKLAPTLYGRGLAKQKLGDTTGAAADMTAAEGITPGIGKIFGTPAILMWRPPAR
jgi:tetratricopeptide (TPR) repeat protein